MNGEMWRLPDKIDAVLAECDASTLEPLAAPPVHPDTQASAWVDAHYRPGEPASVEHGRGWWRRLFKLVVG